MYVISCMNCAKLRSLRLCVSATLLYFGFSYSNTHCQSVLFYSGIFMSGKFKSVN